MRRAPCQGGCTPDEVRRRLFVAGVSLGLGGCALPRGLAPVGAPGPRRPSQVPAFSSLTQAGDLPDGWRERVMRLDKAVTRYDTAYLDDRLVLRARSEGGSSGAGCDVDIDPMAMPWLEWSWRVDDFPADTSVADDDRDDAPVRLVLAFDGDWRSASLRDVIFREQVELFTGHTMPFASLIYVWDGVAPVESVVRYPRSDRIRYLVTQSGPGDTGRWLHYRRNVVDDYRRVFGGTPGPLRNVGVLTDSDDLKQRVEAWYGDIRFGA